MALATNFEGLRNQIPQALFGVSWATASVLLHLAIATGIRSLTIGLLKRSV